MFYSLKRRYFIYPPPPQSTPHVQYIILFAFLCKPIIHSDMNTKPARLIKVLIVYISVDIELN